MYLTMSLYIAYSNMFFILEQPNNYLYCFSKLEKAVSSDLVKEVFVSSSKKEYLMELYTNVLTSP